VSDSHPPVIDRYFTVAAERDTDAFMALFTADADVVTEGQRHRGADAIRSWRDGVAATEGTTTITGSEKLGDRGHRIDTRLGTVDLAYRFTTDDDQITRLQIGG
jgi:hypothetical protein